MHLTIIEVETDDNKNFFAILRSYIITSKICVRAVRVRERERESSCTQHILWIQYIYSSYIYTLLNFCVYLVLKYFEVLAGDVFSIENTMPKKREREIKNLLFLTAKKNVLQLK